MDKPRVEFDHHTSEFARNKRAIAADLIAHQPVAWTDAYDGFWILSRHADIDYAGRHPAVFSSIHDQGSGPRKGVTIPSESNSGGIVESDPPRHTAMRRAMSAWFTPAAVRAMHDSMELDASSFIDQFVESGNADLVADFADPFPGLVTCRMLGLPEDRYDRYAMTVRRVTYTAPDAPDRPEVDALLTLMLDELAQWCQARREDPGDDLLSHLAQAEFDGAQLTIEELTAEALILFAAGTDTVTTLVGHTLCHLSENPAVKDFLLEDHARFSRAFDEYMRYFNPNTGLARTVTEDCVVGGRPLAAGDRVFLWYQAGNQDPDRFECPHEIRLDRPSNQHLAFGVGPHRCIGQHLARAQWEIAIRCLLSRIPDFVVDLERTVRYPDQSQISGFISIPATFAPGRREDRRALPQRGNRS